MQAAKPPAAQHPSCRCHLSHVRLASRQQQVARYRLRAAAQLECLAQLSSPFNPAISVWSIPDDPQFPAEMRNAVILTLDDSGKSHCKANPGHKPASCRPVHITTLSYCSRSHYDCRQHPQPVQAQQPVPDRCLLVCRRCSSCTPKPADNSQSLHE
jgi:hypothetical protein